MDRIVFLDIDGVLNTNRSVTQFGSEDIFDPYCVFALNRILDQTGAKLVVHSNRRLQMDLDTLQEFLFTNGVRGVVIDRAARPGEGGSKATKRHEFIQEWLDGHPCKDRRFVILDDERDMGHLLDHHIRTRERTGLTKELADQAILMLKGATW
jgi:histidinol phosphatase-like enzyme